MITASNIADSWFDPLPIGEYTSLVEKAVPESIPEENACPKDKQLGNLSIACGPTVRFLATHEDDKDNYRGSILIVIRNHPNNEVIPKLSFILGPSNKSVEGQFINKDPIKSEMIYQEDVFTFFRYSFEFDLLSHEQKVQFLIDNQSLSHFQFFLPSIDQSMNVMSFSCNGFSLGTDTSTFKGSLWLDVMRKHSNPIFHYHVMIGGGDQIYADSIKTTSIEFAKWLKHKHLHSVDKLTPEMEQSFKDYYLNRYIEWFGKGYWIGSAGKTIQPIFPIALASIPQINIYDDHDIIDGFGSYSDITMRQEIFQGVGEQAFKYYMLFQHHTIYNEPIEKEPSWVSAKQKGPYIQQLPRSIFAKLGKSIGFIGFDCRTERTKHQIITNDTYELIFERLKIEFTKSNKVNKPMKHLYVLLGVPIAYPRMVWIERLMDSPLVSPLKFLARKGIIARGLVNEFDGQIELLDDLNDHWCAHHHKKERNLLIERLIKFGSDNGVRITILSGDVHLGCISRFRSCDSEILASSDPNFIINIISSAIVNAPPPNGMAKFLSIRAKKHVFNKSTVEDMVPMFHIEPGKSDKRLYPLFMNKRNYADLIPVSNLPRSYVNKRYVDGLVNPGKYFLPGPVTGQCESLTLVQNMENALNTNGLIGYPMDMDGIVATLHIEIESKNTQSETGDYEILVPSLHSK